MKKIDAYTEFHDWNNFCIILNLERQGTRPSNWEWAYCAEENAMGSNGCNGSFWWNFWFFFPFSICLSRKKKTKVYISYSATSLFYFIEREKEN